MEDNKLHIKVLPSGNQTFDLRDSVLILPKAEEFEFTIREYQEEEDAVQEKIAILEKQNSDGFNWLSEDYLEKGADGWTDKERSSFKANSKIRNETQEKNNSDIATLKNNIKVKYNDVVWVWSLYKNLSKRVYDVANKTLGKGIGNGLKTRNFPKALEGGGHIWLEPFFEGTDPIGRPPFGCYVKALGTPKIVNVKWTDDIEGKNNISKTKFNQTLFLHIETEGLYGQDIDIYLMDKDLNPDDEIPATVIQKHFQREVSVFSKNGTSNGIKDSSHIQKVILKLTIDISWKQLFDDIDLYPKIVYKEVGINKLFDGSQLLVNGDKKTEAPEGNIAVVKGKIDTDVGEFHPCRYEKIVVKFEEDDKPKSLTLYDSKDQSGKKELMYPVVAGIDQKRKKFTINVSEVSTDECFFEGSPNTHKDHVIDISELEYKIEQNKKERSSQWRGGDTSKVLSGGEIKTEKSGDQNEDRKIDASHVTHELKFINGISQIKAQKSFKILENYRPFRLQQPSDEKFELEVGYDYSFNKTKHPLLGLFSTIIPNGKKSVQSYPIRINTCARAKALEIAVLPDTKWTIQLGFNYDKGKFNAIREAYHQKWEHKELEAEDAKKRLESKRDNAQAEHMDMYQDAQKAKGKKKKKLAKKEKKYFKKNVERENARIAKVDAKLQKAKSKTSAKGKLSKAVDLIELDDALEHGLIDCNFAMIAEFDRPYGALEVSSHMHEITDFIKKVADIKEKVENIVNGKDSRANQKKPKANNKRLNNLKKKLDVKKAKGTKRSNWSFEFIPPSIGLSLSWHAERPKDLDKPVVGTMFQGVIDMNPLFGFEIKYDVYQLLYKLRHPAILAVVATLDLLDEGLGDNFDINLDLIVTSTISGTIMGMVNTAEGSKYSNRLMQDEDDTPAKCGGAVNIRLLGEIQAQGKIDPLFFKKKQVYGRVEASAESGISMEFVTKANEKSIFVEPEIKFEGLILKAGFSAGMTDIDMGNESSVESIENLKNKTGLHYTANGEVIVFDPYEWEMKNWQIPIYSFK